jgi:chemotaxis protein MotB
MKKSVKVFASCAMIVCLALTQGCVSKKKFNEVAVHRDKVEIENDQLKKRLAQQEGDIIGLKSELDILSATKKELGTVRQQLQNTEDELADNRRRIEELLDQNRRILTTASGEKEALIAALSDKEIALEDKQRELKALENALIERERKLQELSDKIKAQDARMNAMKDRISQALLGFSANDLTVEQKNGRVYVTLSQNLLFPKGSRVVDKDGVNALRKLAEVLRQNTDFQINVEGHTDSDGSEELNWDLSANRATSIVKILRENGVQANRLTASGRAFFDPVAPNDNEANKTKNRRTEIILSPRLEDLMELIR